MPPRLLTSPFSTLTNEEQYQLAVGVGLALSVPFILLALNLERITALLRHTGSIIARSLDRSDDSVATPSPVWIIVVAMLILVVVVWTSQMATGVKAALSITLVLFALGLVAFLAIYSLVNAARAAVQGAVFESSDID